MSKIALLSIGDIYTSDDLDTTHSDQLQADINSTYGDVEVASNVIDTAEDVAEHLEAQKQIFDEPAGVTESNIKQATESIKLASKITGNNFSRVRASLESNSISKEDISKELSLAVESLHKQISIAQEGVFEKIGYTLGNLTTGSDAVKSRAIEAAQKQVKDEQQLVNAAFTKHITTRKNKNVVTGEDTINTLKELQQFVNSSVISKTISDLHEIAKEFKKDNKGNFLFFYSDETKHKLRSHIASLEEISKRFDVLQPEGAVVNAVTMSDSQMKTCSALVQKTAEIDPSIKKAMKETKSAARNADDWRKAFAAFFGIIGIGMVVFNSGTAAHRVFFSDVSRIIKTITSIYKSLNDAAYAAVRHMEASVKN